MTNATLSLVGCRRRDSAAAEQTSDMFAKVAAFISICLTSRDIRDRIALCPRNWGRELALSAKNMAEMGR